MGICQRTNDGHIMVYNAIFICIDEHENSNQEWCKQVIK